MIDIQYNNSCIGREMPLTVTNNKIDDISFKKISDICKLLNYLLTGKIEEPNLNNYSNKNDGEYMYKIGTTIYKPIQPFFNNLTMNVYIIDDKIFIMNVLSDLARKIIVKIKEKNINIDQYENYYIVDIGLPSRSGPINNDDHKFAFDTLSYINNTLFINYLSGDNLKDYPITDHIYNSSYNSNICKTIDVNKIDN